MIKANKKVGFFVTFLLIGFMFLVGNCVSKVEPTKEQCRIDSVQKADSVKADTTPSLAKGNKSK